MLDLLKIIEDHGFVAYYVGGYPRDHYMGLETEDYDLCTNARPVDIKQFLNVDMSFSWYGNVRFMYDGHNVEITTFRKDSEYVDHRHPNKVDYVETLREDLERRDFIINTLCIDSKGNYIDLLGARKDIDLKIIRTVGNADMKLSEDVIRILRAIRFAARFDFKLDSELEASIMKNKYLLAHLDSKKKQKEIDKILAYKKGEQLLNKFGIIVSR